MHDRAESEIASVDGPVAVQAETEDEPTGRGDLLLVAVQFNTVDLSRFSTGIDLSLWTNSDPFRVIQAFDKGREILDPHQAWPLGCAHHIRPPWRDPESPALLLTRGETGARVAGRTIGPSPMTVGKGLGCGRADRDNSVASVITAEHTSDTI